MSTSNIKLLAWSCAGILGVLMSGYVFLFFQKLEVINQRVESETLSEVLDNVEIIEETALKKVPYDQIKRGMIELNWTGKLPVEDDVEGPKPPPEPEVTSIPLVELVSVTMIVGDSDSPDASFCHLKYLPEAKLPPAILETASFGVRFVGDQLPDKLSYVTVKEIGPAGVTFSFADETREPETLLPPTFQLGSGIVSMAEGSEFHPKQERRIVIRRDDSGAAAKTYEYKPGHFRIGTEDAEYIGENYSEILAREVRTVKHRDPATGKYDGVEVRSVAQGSVASSHGIAEGDVIKSINGQSVTSVSQALNYVKQNADLFDTWDVVVVNKGLEKIVTYKSPPK